ncbi:MAG: HdeA/HdeB family chaperone [Gammaproteobacteria bacterium]
MTLQWGGTSAYAADDTGQYLTMGLGNLSCKSFLSEDEEGAAYYLSWLAGYMTAYNHLAEETYSIMGKTKTIGQIESWLRDYCTVNGDETFESATRNLLRNLKYFRVKQKQ